MTSKEKLQLLIQEKLKDHLFVLVSHREPYVHSFQKGKVVCKRTPGGVVSALDPVMRASHGIWFAVGDGDADYRISGDTGIYKVGEGTDSFYTLKRIYLSKNELEGYYLGYSNNALWPLSHTAFKRPQFRLEDWETYKKVNYKFAQEIIRNLGNQKAFVWIQDYHFCLLAKYLRQLAPEALFIAQFWHIPWPSYETFRICPHKLELLEGLLSNDLLGFHLPYHCNNFFDVLSREIECKVDQEKRSVVRQGHETFIRPYPISIDFEEIQKTNAQRDPSLDANLIEQFDLSGKKIMLGLDRIDYTKGIPERLSAVDRFFDKYPEFKEKVVLLQMGAISRLHLQEYKLLNDQLNTMVEQINWKHATNQWTPIILIRKNSSFHEVLSFYRIATLCIVSSLHDGMNLVAKEYVSSVPEDKGMLLLSQFTGAARELKDAILINPYDIEQFADKIYQALTLNEEERKQRIERMQQIIKQHDVYKWASQIIQEMITIYSSEQVHP